MTHTRWIVSALLATVGALGLGGCYYDFSDDRDRDDTPGATAPSYGSSPGTSASRWSGRAETFRGGMGDLRAFEGADAEVSGVDYGNNTSTVRIDAEDTRARWWAMTQFSFSGSLHHPRLVPGAQLVFGPRSAGPRATGGDAQALYVSVLGCSGPRRNQFTYDRGAEEVRINVSEGPSPDTRRIDFDATFEGPTGDQHVTGSFVYDLQ